MTKDKKPQNLTTKVDELKKSKLYKHASRNGKRRLIFGTRRRIQAIRTEKLWSNARKYKVIPGLMENESANGPATKTCRALTPDQLSTLASLVAARMEANLLKTNQVYTDADHCADWSPLPISPTLPTMSSAFAARIEYMVMLLAKTVASRAYKTSKTMNRDTVRVSARTVKLTCEMLAKQLSQAPVCAVVPSTYKYKPVSTKKEFVGAVLQ